MQTLWRNKQQRKGLRTMVTSNTANQPDARNIVENNNAPINPMENNKGFLVLWVVLGLFLGPFGVCAAFLMARKGSEHFRDNAVWFSLIGFTLFLIAQMGYMIVTGHSPLEPLFTPFQTEKPHSIW